MNRYLAIESIHMRTRRFLIFLVPFALLLFFSVVINFIMTMNGEALTVETLLFKVANNNMFNGLLILWLIYEVAYGYQKGIYKRYLTDGFSRLDLLTRQLFAVLVYTIIMFILIQIFTLGMGLKEGYALSDLLLKQHIPSWINQLLLLLYSGTAALLFGNLFGNYYAILIFWGWGMIENVIIMLNDRYLEWEWLNYLPMKSRDLIVGSNFMDTTDIVVLSVFFALFLIGNTLLIKNKTL